MGDLQSPSDKGKTIAVARLLRGAGIDRAVAFTILGRGWAAFSGIISLALLTHFLTGAEQGFYFLFAEVLAVQIFFELGLAYVLVQFASHERARLEWTNAGLLDGDPIALARLASLLRLSVRWYAVVAALIVLLVLPGGWLFFSLHAPSGSNIAWNWPWVWIVVVTAGSLLLSPLLAVLEGCGLIAEIARFQIYQNVAGSILFWGALLSHWGLATAPITNTVMLLSSAGWLWFTKGRLLSDIWAGANSRDRIDWKQELWPLQWRMALTWLGGYFVFHIFQPLLYVYQGPVASGRLGLSLAITAALGGVALAWVSTKAAPFGMLIARQDYRELDRRFFPCLWQSLGILSLGCLLIWLGDAALFWQHSPLRLRILDPLPMALLLAATVSTHVIFSEAVYLRAHKQEPFLGITLVQGLCAAIASVVLGRFYGVTGMMLGYFIFSLLIGVGGGTWIFRQKRAQWHISDPATLEKPLLENT